MSLIKNSSWNLIGTAASAAMMIPAMGFFARQLDIETFGLLTLVLAFVGYASVLDGGFSRAVVRELAQVGDDFLEAKRVLGTGIVVVVALGIAFGGILWVFAPSLVELIRVNDSLKHDAVDGFRWTALMILPILIGMMWMAPIEAQSDFIRLNILRTIGYALVFGCAAVAVYWEPTFPSVALGLLVGRIGMALLALSVTKKVMGLYLYPFSRVALKKLVRFGGWLTVSSILVPIVYYLDRFVLSAFVGASAIAFYAAPSEAINKTLTLPGSVARALFPMLASAKTDEVTQLRRVALMIQSGLGIMLVITVLLFGEQIMGLWLGAEYAAESGLVLKILIFGVLFNALSMVPLMELQAMGYSKHTAVAHMLEVLPIIVMLLLLTYWFGIVGTAIAWVCGTLLDCCLQMYLCQRVRKRVVES